MSRILEIKSYDKSFFIDLDEVAHVGIINDCDDPNFSNYLVVFKSGYELYIIELQIKRKDFIRKWIGEKNN